MDSMACWKIQHLSKIFRLATSKWHKLGVLLEYTPFLYKPKEVNAMLLPYQSTKIHVLLEETMASKGKVRVRLMNV